MSTPSIPHVVRPGAIFLYDYGTMITEDGTAFVNNSALEDGGKGDLTSSMPVVSSLQSHQQNREKHSRTLFVNGVGQQRRRGEGVPFPFRPGAQCQTCWKHRELFGRYCKSRFLATSPVSCVPPHYPRCGAVGLRLSTPEVMATPRQARRNGRNVGHPCVPTGRGHRQNSGRGTRKRD